MKKGIYLLVTVFALTAFASCTTESVEETENLQNFEEQFSDDGGGGNDDEDHGNWVQ